MAINYLAVLVAGIANVVIGSFWYSPSVFGNTWMKLSGIKKPVMTDKIKRKMMLSYLLVFIGALVMSFVVASFINYTGKTTFVEAVSFAFFVWLGFIATTTLGIVLWEGKSWKLWILHNCYWIISLIVMTTIVTLWV